MDDTTEPTADEDAEFFERIFRTNPDLKARLEAPLDRARLVGRPPRPPRPEPPVAP